MASVVSMVSYRDKTGGDTDFLVWSLIRLIWRRKVLKTGFSDAITGNPSWYWEYSISYKP